MPPYEPRPRVATTGLAGGQHDHRPVRSTLLQRQHPQPILEVLIIAFHRITVVVAYGTHDGCGFISTLKLITLRANESKNCNYASQHSPLPTLPSDGDVSFNYPYTHISFYHIQCSLNHFNRTHSAGIFCHERRTIYNIPFSIHVSTIILPTILSTHIPHNNIRPKSYHHELIIRYHFLPPPLAAYRIDPKYFTSCYRIPWVIAREKSTLTSTYHFQFQSNNVTGLLIIANSLSNSEITQEAYERMGLTGEALSRDQATPIPLSNGVPAQILHFNGLAPTSCKNVHS